MTCPFLKPHQCANCEKGQFRCEAHAPLIQVVEENLHECFMDSHVDCEFYAVGMSYLDAEAKRGIEEKKKNGLLDAAMEALEVVLTKKSGYQMLPEGLGEVETLRWQLGRLKELYRARLSDLHEYKASLRRCKGEADGAQ